jgi:hypothetical protein
MAPNKESMEMSIPGMGTIMKQKFDGVSGFSEQQGMKSPLSEEEIAEKQEAKGLFPETYLEATQLELVSLNTVDGVDVYKIKVSGIKETFRYYDASSHFLVRVEKTQDLPDGQSITVIEDYTDYKPVDGLMLPHGTKTTQGQQVFKLNYTEILLNEGVSDEDFK